MELLKFIPPLLQIPEFAGGKAVIPTEGEEQDSEWDGEPDSAETGEEQSTDAVDGYGIVLVELPILITDVNDIYTMEFLSWGSFVDKAEQGHSTMTMDRRSSYKKEEGRYSDWYKTPNMQEALRLAREGWPEGVKLMLRKMDIIQSQIPLKQLVKAMVMQQVGPGTIDMNRYKMGHPQPWVTWQPQDDSTQGQGKVVTILYNITASAGVSTDAMFEKGATICILTDLLEKAGRRVEIKLVMATKYYHGKGITTKIMVKKASDPLDADRLAFALAHASCFRRLGFSIWEQSPESYLKALDIGGTYGRCHDISEDGCINILSSDLASSYAEENQLDWLKKQLEEQGMNMIMENKR